MGARERRRIGERKAVRIGAVAIVVAVGSTVFAVTAQNGMPEYLPGVSRTTAEAAFADVGALRSGDDVRIANVRVGFVDDIRLEGEKAVVTMKLDDNRPVYRDATASIGARSALGQKYVELSPGSESAGEIDEDFLISQDKTDGAIELDELINVFDGKTRTAAGSTLRQLGGGVGGRGGDLNDALRSSPEMLEDLGAVTRSLSADNGADLTQLLQAADSLSSSIVDQSPVIAQDVRQLSTTLDALADDDGKTLGEVIETAPDVLADVRTTLTKLDPALDATSSATRNLRPGAEALGRAVPDVRAVLRDAVRPLGDVPAVGDKTETALRALTPALDEGLLTVQQLRTSVQALSMILVGLAPYSPEVLDFFQNSSSALGSGDAAGHWLRLYTVVNPETVTGLSPFGNPLTKRQAYPAPGEAKTHHTNAKLGGN